MKYFNILIVGFGSIGKKHAEAITKVNEAELIAVVDKNEDVFTIFFLKYNANYIFSETLDSSSVPAPIS